MHSHSFSSVKEFEEEEPTFRPKRNSTQVKQTEVAELEASEGQFRK
jgi:hypothetical protein